MADSLTTYKNAAIQRLIDAGCRVDHARRTGDGRGKLSTPRVAIMSCADEHEVDWHVRYFLSAEGFR